MTRVITCLGGKGGVGKTTLVANLGTAMTEIGANVLVVDSNLTTPNLGIHLGIPLYPKTLHDVLKGKANIHEAIYTHPSGLKVIPAGLALSDMRGAEPKDLSNALLEVLGAYDVIIIDGSAGLGREALAAMEAGDELLLVSTPDLPAITDALKAIRLAQQVGTKTMGVVINRIIGKKHEMTREEIRSMLETPIIAEIPEDHSVGESIAYRRPLVKHKPNSPAAKEFRRLAADLLGYEIQEPWWKRIFGF